MSDFPGGLDGKAFAYNDRVLGSIPGLGISPGEGNCTPVFLTGESHGQRNLAGYCLWGCKIWTQLSTAQHKIV